MLFFILLFTAKATAPMLIAIILPLFKYVALSLLTKGGVTVDAGGGAVLKPMLCLGEYLFLTSHANVPMLVLIIFPRITGCMLGVAGGRGEDILTVKADLRLGLGCLGAGGVRLNGAYCAAIRVGAFMCVSRRILVSKDGRIKNMIGERTVLYGTDGANSTSGAGCSTAGASFLPLSVVAPGYGAREEVLAALCRKLVRIDTVAVVIRIEKLVLVFRIVLGAGATSCADVPIALLLLAGTIRPLILFVYSHLEVCMRKGFVIDTLFGNFNLCVFVGKQLSAGAGIMVNVTSLGTGLGFGRNEHKIGRAHV